MRLRTPCIALVTTLVSLHTARAYADVGEDESLYSCTKAHTDVFVNLKPETQLPDLVDWAMTFTCKKFIYNSKLEGRSAPVTLVAPGKLSPSEAWRVFLVALQSANLTVVPKHGILEIVEAPTAKEKPLPVYKPQDVRAEDQIVRVILRPEHVGVEDLAEALAAIKSKDGAVVTLSNAGILLVTDYGSTIDRMLTVVKLVDEPVEREHIYIVKLEHADAAATATKLTELLTTNGAPARARTRTRAKTNEVIEMTASAPTKIIPDERTNTLLIVAEDLVYQRLRKLIKYIDLPMPGGEGGMYVYRLENADATALATTLTNSLTSASASTGAGQPKRAAAAPSAGALGGVAFEGEVRVTADTESNSLVVIASVWDFAALREVIGELDRPRRQVFIEAVIVELTLDNSRTLGVTFHAGDVRKVGGKDSAVFGGAQHSTLSSLNLADSLQKSGTGGIAGIVGPKLPGIEELLGISVPSFSVLVQALATRGHLDVVSAPHLTAMDNKESIITVGRNIPFQSNTTGLSLATPSTTTPFTAGTSVERQKVGLTLKIKPFINESDLIRLEIDQELQDLAPPVNDLGPTWTERKITTSVVVQDQQTVVIGGLVQERLQTDESKVPLLGDIPILGQLFRREHRIKQKTNLLVILTPYVIKDPTDMQRILERKTRQQDEFAATLETFDHAGYRAEVDYSRRRGVIEEMNQSVMKVEREKALLEEFKQELSYPDGAIE